MDGQVDYVELVERAQRGDRQSLDTLAGIARERLRVYVYRLTQQDDLAQEITQESLLEMCKVLGKLQQTDRFWGWLYGIATNKLHRHYRTERALQHAAASEERRQGAMKERQGGFENLVSQELKQIVSAAMQKLRTRHKAVLVMRCYDGMSYAEIADSMGCSEFSTRMLFMRAKQALQKELGRGGFGKGSLLAALVVFGKMTAPSEAAAAQLTVPVAALNVGLVAGAVGVATTKTAVVSVAAAGILTMGTVVATSDLGGRSAADGNVLTGSVAASLYDAGQTARPSYWFYFPGEPDGSMMLRATADPARPDRRVLQNAQGNYVYEGATVQINNARTWMDDLSVFTLPTDSSAMRAALSRVAGQSPAIEPVTAKGRGLLVVVERTADGSAQPWAVKLRNVLTEDYFQSDWRSDATVVDNRDAMHKRGWTYFRVRGRIGDRNVTGVGRVPFVYAVARERSPWLKLRVGDNLTILDSDAVACTIDARGTLLSRSERGSFFKGLGRPWMGLHTMDTVRRDAAQRRAMFETVRMSDGRRVQVTTVDGRTKLVYTIDLETDVVEKIALLVGDAPAGSLEFEYLQDLPAADREFTVPSTRNYQGSPSKSAATFWLAALAEAKSAD